MNCIEQLSNFSKIVSDTADINLVKEFQPLDATTNPSLLLKMLDQKEYQSIFSNSRNWSLSFQNSANLPQEDILYCTVAVSFGCEILKHIKGRVSTEVPARYSFDIVNTINLAKTIITLYQEKKIPLKKVLIKIAATWEGIQAARQLEKEGIYTNLTLLFSLPQAIACAEAKVQLISPFVGRVYDWYKKKLSQDYQGNDDPGVQLVSLIYNYYKKFDYSTEIMGASFRNINQIINLAGCDLLTISPTLLEELKNLSNQLEVKLTPEQAKKSDLVEKTFSQKEFLWEFHQDAMAVEKLAEGIRIFHQDYLKLNQLLKRGS